MRSQPPPIDMAQFAEHAAKGVSAQRLAARYGRSVRTILTIAAKEGITLKTPRLLKAEARKVLADVDGASARTPKRI